MIKILQHKEVIVQLVEAIKNKSISIFQFLKYIINKGKSEVKAIQEKHLNINLLNN